MGIPVSTRVTTNKWCNHTNTINIPTPTSLERLLGNQLEDSIHIQKAVSRYTTVSLLKNQSRPA